MRLDQALARLFPQYSRTRLQTWVRRGRVTLDGSAARIRQAVRAGQLVALDPELEPSQRADAPQAIPLAIVFEDAALIVVDKPPGLVVHPGSGNPDGTLVNALLHRAPELRALSRAGVVHRLDKDTSGLLVVAKTIEAQLALTRQLQARTVQRAYLALVAGNPPAQGSIAAPIGRHPTARTRMAVVASGRQARTHYRVLKRGTGWSLLECRLETGRTHQIRVHLHSLGHPLIGDRTYGTHRPVPSPTAVAFPRQALHAARLELDHPVTGARCAWSSPLPADLAGLLAELERDAPAA